MQTTPLVAIVILNFNGKHYLQQFLPSIKSSTYPNFRIVVGDNASTDESVTWLTEYYPEVEIIHNTVNYGFAKGYNEVLKHVGADYYVLLNSDVEVTPGWIEPVINLMERDHTIGACQPKMLAYHDKNSFEYAGAAGGWIDMLGYPFSRGRVFDYCEHDHGQYNEALSVFWASGAAFFVRPQLFSYLRGFDEYFFAHQEEIDLCWRMQLAGYQIMACPQSVVYHVGGGTLPQGKRKVYLNLRNNLVMVSKNWALTEKVWKLPVRWALDTISAWRALLTGDTPFFMGVFDAHLSYLKWLVGSKKQNVFPTSRERRVKGCYKGSIVFQYFIKKRKTFDEIVTKTH